MSGRVFFETAKETVGEAIRLDGAGQHVRAYAMYKKALDQFVLAIKYEKNEKTKEVLKKRCEEYLDRAEALQKMLKSKPTPVEEGGKTPEVQKLERSLADSIISEKPNVKWSDVAGLEPTKIALKEAVVLPVKFPQFFSPENPPWRGILLYGPPGTGKSFLAKAVATESDSTFFSVSAADLGSKWHGESEKLVRTLFQMARLRSPSIVFIDEVDSLCSAREQGQSDVSQRVKTEFLRQMDGITPTSSSTTLRILTLGATNLPWVLDVAMRRRFEKRIYVPLPDEAGRKKLFQLRVGKSVTSLKEEDYVKLAKRSEGYTGADLAIVVREALMLPLREYQSATHFIEGKDGFWLPVTNFKPCPECPESMNINSDSKNVETQDIETKESKDDAFLNCPRCVTCKRYKISLFDAPSRKFKRPIAKSAYFYHALKSISNSVSPKELKKFVQWTEEFGQYGSG